MKLNLKILQLPLLELKQNLEAELNQNPALEEEIEKESEVSSDESNALSNEQPDTWEEIEEPTFSNDAEPELVEIRELEKRKNYQESLIVQRTTLTDFIYSQLYLLDLSDEEELWSHELIGNLNEDGFLKENLSSLARRIQTPESALEKLIKKLQQLEPAGVFAKSIEECLAIQLKRKKGADSEIAHDIVMHNFELLQKKQFTGLAGIYKTSPDHIQTIFEMIQHLDPKPGKAFLTAEPLSVIPDIIITAQRGEKEKYKTEVEELGLPKLKVTSEYRQMVKDRSLDTKTKKFVKDNVEKALWLVEALNYRKATLTAITKEIVKRQPVFFEKGFSSLKPLRMKEIAGSLNIHESTVSRAIAGKYIQTPVGTYPLRSFFSGSVPSGAEEESQKSVMERIKQLIEDEDVKHPLSDQKIVNILSEEGIQLARRTVAKYREMMKILPTSLRRVR